jgi:hypothetical protein
LAGSGHVYKRAGIYFIAYSHGASPAGQRATMREQNR